MIKRYLVTLLLCLSTTVAMAELEHITVQQLTTLMQQGVTVIDIRTPEEWKQTGIVKGSHAIMFFDKNGKPYIEEWLQQSQHLINPDEAVILICRSGNRTTKVGNFLSKQMGFKKVYSVKGGIKSWQKAGYETQASR
ncbi:MAG: rhodanese-like domain-containing protein [Gammaproteobacteria bacterium]|jgi:rhodanese-related sulfurtransferase|nr:rhodanese-like domain-containing protein [Gammaproteobacteria bacterium]|tara:strand:+ start:3890 stop:4300 length:411 start_codon:yes stop_codon:yes gene_type:complete